jgi:hypothetical protein
MCAPTVLEWAGTIDDAGDDDDDDDDEGQVDEEEEEGVERESDAGRT